MKKALTFVITVTLLLTLLVGCNTTAQTPSPAPDTLITVTDLSGTVVTFDQTPKKVVSLVPSVTELLFEMGAGSLICGRDSYSYYPAQAADIPIMGDYNGPNLELIIASAPDVVFTAGKLQQDAETRLRDAGIKVVNAEAATINDIKPCIELLGTVVGKSQQAAEMVATLERGIEDIKALNTKKVSVYYMVSSGEYGEWTVGPGSFIYDALTLGGAELITKDMQFAYPQYSVESIVENDPYVIIADTNTTLEYLQGHEALGKLDAVKNNRVIIIDADIVSRPTLRFITAIKNCIEEMHTL